MHISLAIQMAMGFCNNVDVNVHCPYNGNVMWVYEKWFYSSSDFILVYIIKYAFFCVQYHFMPDKKLFY